MADSKRRSVRQRQLAGRKRSMYYESEIEDEHEFEAESAGEDDFRPQVGEPGPSRPQRSSKKRKLGRSNPKPQTRSKEKRQRSFARADGESKKRKRTYTLFPPTPSKNREEKRRFSGPSDGKIPAWTSLPLEVLRDIFIFASQPLHEYTTTAT